MRRLALGGHRDCVAGAFIEPVEAALVGVHVRVGVPASAVAAADPSQRG
jgi:hypothetical protein